MGGCALPAGKLSGELHVGMGHHHRGRLGVIPIGYSAAAHDDDIRTSSEV